jgi:hypothetical protein
MSERDTLMPVFISHRAADDALARRVWLYLTDRQIPCYIDDLDREAKTTDDITELILRRLGMTTHLIAVVTQNTAGSWWVPFEIGVATESAKRIASYTRLRSLLPEYLLKWPALESDSDLAIFAREYHRDRPIIEKRASAGRPAQRVDADSFHRSLKAAIGQR